MAFSMLPVKKKLEMFQMMRCKKKNSSYQIAIFKFHKLFSTLILVYSIIVSDNTLAISRSLVAGQSIEEINEKEWNDKPPQSIERLLLRTFGSDEFFVNSWQLVEALRCMKAILVAGLDYSPW